METISHVLSRTQLQSLIDALASDGFSVIGPRAQDGAIVFGEVAKDTDLPIGWTDIQTGGEYRLARRKDEKVFGFVVGPHSLKRHLFVPRRQLLSADKDESGSFVVTERVDKPEKLAVLGVRPCDVAAMLIQDRVFAGDGFKDPDYVRRRENMFVIAVNCSDPASTCFCTSMESGPRCESGYDLALTEIYTSDRHDFLIEVGSKAGKRILKKLNAVPATDLDVQAARNVTAVAEKSIRKTMNTDGIRDLLLGNLEHPMWDDVADRCLTCANCTMVCPTCFCSTVEEVTDLTGDHAERWQTWDSCFTVDHSYIHGGGIRKTSRARYRQWMTHKLASWIDQFGTSGCTGCGRCITWCPVAIDITEEVEKLR